jgi:glycosyltransferase involved in cell wall biosynthesis
MTIALVANSSWNLHHFRRSLIKRLMAEGYDILLLAPEDKYTPHLADFPNTRYIPLRHLQAQRKNPFRDLRLLQELYHIYRREQPDMVLHFTIKPNLYGSLAAGWLGIPSIATVTGLGYTFIHDRFSHRLVRMLYGFAFRKSTKVVFQNPDDKNLFLQLGLVDNNQHFLIPGSGVDTNYFTPQPQSKNTDAFIYLFIGRLLFDKGIREFHAAAQFLQQPGRVFWVVGEQLPDHPNGIPEALLQSWVESGAIQYQGYQEDVRPFLAQADVLVLPSYREGLPRSVLEAMSMAKPILTTNVPGSRETVEPGKNGLLIPVKSVKALATAMNQLQEMDSDQLSQWGQYSRQLVVKKFSQKVVNDLYLELIKNEEGTA